MSRCARYDLDAFFAAGEALYEQIFTLSGFPGACQAMQPLKLQPDRARRLSLLEKAQVAELIGKHSPIVDALQAGDTGSALSSVSRHARHILDDAAAQRIAPPDLLTD